MSFAVLLEVPLDASKSVLRAEREEKQEAHSNALPETLLSLVKEPDTSYTDKANMERKGPTKPTAA